MITVNIIHFALYGKYTKINVILVRCIQSVEIFCMIIYLPLPFFTLNCHMYIIFLADHFTPLVIFYCH